MWSGEVMDRLWAKVAVGGQNDCWEWLGPKTPRGYGVFRAGGKGAKATHATRFVLEHKIGRPNASEARA